ncbi:MAG TPA: hypothetical protein VL588_09400, partial [Bdellovibrionota bacterium]|nr:hypothetical protein [Bdellovibrionota bacterium]
MRVAPQWRLPLAVAPFFLWAHVRFGLWNASQKNTGFDGGYYTDIAQNVRDHLGFVTDVSPFHQSLPYFPHPSPVYPLWPWILGLLGRVFPMDSMIYVLPPILGITTLVLAWKVGRAAFPRLVLKWKGVELHGGHFLVMAFAFHRLFLESTARPYTEGLAYSLLFCALLRAKRL